MTFAIGLIDTHLDLNELCIGAKLNAKWHMPI